MNDEKTELYDVLIAGTSSEKGEGTVELITAGDAKIISTADRAKYIEFSNGFIYKAQVDQLDVSASRFEVYGQLMAEPKSKLVEIDSTDAIPTRELMKSLGSVANDAAIYWRIFMPLLVPIIALLALGLSETSHRRGRYIKLLPGIIIYVLYLAALIAVKTEMEKGRLAGPLPFVFVHVFFFGLALAIIYFNELKGTFSRGLAK
jgi:lipopolysaccharide export system permease protein